MIETIMKTIKEHDLLADGDRVIVGLSGGPDSMALLHVLWTLTIPMRITLKAIHVNHCLRPFEADLDQEAAVQLCERLNIPIEIIRVDVESIAAERGLSTELAGREIRYEAFHRAQQTEGYQKIALAHHADDQCETVLMRLLRGAGIEGLAGMRVKRPDGVIRPLLHVTKADIEAYADACELGARVDSTNLEALYVRNKYRLELVPLLKSSYNPNIVHAMTHLAEEMQRDSDCLNEQAVEALTPWILSETHISIPLESMTELHPSIQSRVVRLAYEHLQGSKKDLSRSHVHAVLNLLNSSQGSKVFVFKRVKFSREYAVLNITQINSPMTSVDEDSMVHFQSEQRPPVLRIKRIHRNQKMELRDTDTVIYIDEEAVVGPLRFRHRQEGDRFSPFMGKGSKKLKAYFIDQKLPREKRDEVWLLADDVSIFWVEGFGRSRIGCVSDQSDHILEILMT